MKKLFFAFIALITVFTFASCNNDDEPVVKPTTPVKFELLKVDPADGSSSISQTQKFTLTFSKPIVTDAAVLAKSIAYEPSTYNKNFSWTLSASGNVLTVQFTSTDCAKGSEFYLSLFNFTSVDGDVIKGKSLHYFYK